MYKTKIMKNRINNTLSLKCKDLSANENNIFSFNGISVRLYHKTGEPHTANRLEIKTSNLTAELLPSKGLSLGQVSYNEKKIFWEAPFYLPNPDMLDLWSDEVQINNQPMAGFTYLKTFTAGIELYGLKNWGMPRKNDQTGELLPLHGETSNIPVDEINILIDEPFVQVEATFVYHDMNSGGYLSWYTSGSPMYKINRLYKFHVNNPQVTLSDTIENISGENLTPDWGYRVTFYPQPGSKILVPSGSVEERNGEKIPNDIETWNMAGSDEPRQETGIIHKRLNTIREEGKERCRVLLQHPNGDGILFKFPPSPYFQTWSCKGGAGSDEFKLRSGKSLLENNWDGLGIEIGSSALDHDNNIDQSVKYQAILPPGSKKSLDMELSIPDPLEVMEMASSIKKYNKNRKL